MEEQTTPAVVSRPKGAGGKPVLWAVLVVILIAAAAGATYFWQHKKLTNTNAALTAANTKISMLNGTAASQQKKLDSLQSQYNQAKATIDSYQAAAQNARTEVVVATQADLGLTVNGAQYVNPAGSVTSGGKWFGVNVTLTNNTSNAISVNDSDFQLKDQQNNSYTEETMQNASTLPSGWTSLPNQILTPGQTLKGTVIFQMPNDTVKDFTFVNVTKAFPVHSAN